MAGKSMTSGSPIIHILKFALPVFLGNLLQQLYNTVDTIIVGKYSGEDSLAAVGTTATVTFFFIAIATGFSGGNGVLVSQFFGAKEEGKLRQAAATGIDILMLLGLFCTVLGFLSARIIFKYLVDVPSDILEETILYFRIYAIGLIFQFGYNSFAALLRAVGDSTATLLFLLISSVLNIGLDLLFVKVWHTGVAGAAIATVISQAASFAASLLYMIKKYPFFRFRMKELNPVSQMVRGTITMGLPMTLQLVSVSIGLTFIQRAVNGFGKIMTASYTVGNRIEMYLNLPGNALQTTLATYTGQNYGAGKMDRVKKGALMGSLASFLLSLVIAVAIWFSADGIIGLFSISEEASLYCIQHLHAIAVINLLLAAYIAMLGVFQGTGHALLAMIVALTVLTVRVIVTYIFRYSDFLGYRIIWLNGAFGFTVGIVIAWTFFFTGKWKPKTQK